MDYPSKCPESTYFHGPPDAYGYCPWCKAKVAVTYKWRPKNVPSQVEDAYRETWDPDYPFPLRKEDEYY